jgi:predicted  nucleic acid-binding Zn-ribbon protein
MAEQEVRPQQLSIAEIARLWSAETGDKAEDLERDLADWAYAAAADGAEIGTEGAAKDSGPAALKVEPDPHRQLRWDDVEAFCRERDLLLPHFWQEPPAESPARPSPGPVTKADKSSGGGSVDMSRLVVRAMDRMGPKPLLAVAERRGPAGGAATAQAHQEEPDEPETAVKGEVLKAADAAPKPKPSENAPHAKDTAAREEPRLGKLTLAASRDSAATTAQPERGARVEPRLNIESPKDAPARPNATQTAGGATSAKATTSPEAPSATDRAQEPDDRDEQAAARDRRTTVVRTLRGAKKPAANDKTTRPRTKTPANLKEVPVRVMRPRPISTTANQPRGGAWTGLLGGALCGAILVGVAAAAWVEFEGGGLQAFVLGETGPSSEVLALQEQLAEAEVRSLAAGANTERLTTQLSDSQRQLDTLRARIADISSLGERLTEAQRDNAQLRAKVQELTAALDVARGGGDAARRAMQKELVAVRKELSSATEAAAAAQKDAVRLNDDLATAHGEIEAAKLARMRLEKQNAALTADLTKAHDEVENLTQSAAAAAAGARGLEEQLAAAKKDLAAASQARSELEAKVAALDSQMNESGNRTKQLGEANSAAEAETRRLGAALDAAKTDAATAQEAVGKANSEIARLSAALAEAHRATAKAQGEREAAQARALEIEKDLSLALKANTDLRAEADNLNAQAAQLTEFLAKAREENTALAKSLTGAQDETKALRKAVENSGGDSAQLTAKLAEAERRASALEEERRAATTQVEALNRELADLRKTADALRSAAQKSQDSSDLAEKLAAAERRAADQEAQRQTAQARLESLVVTLAAARSEIQALQVGAKQASEERNWLLEAVESWKAEAKVLEATLAAAEQRAAGAGTLAAAPADASKEQLIATAPNAAGAPIKLTPGDATQLASATDTAADMIRRGRGLLSRGDIAGARNEFRQAAEIGDPVALTAIAQTYDPRILQGLGVLEAFANATTAERLYERASATGDPAAAQQLQAMRAWLKP